MKIGVRLGLAFLLLILTSVAIAVFASMQLNNVSAEASTLVENRMIKVEQLSTLSDNVNIIARAARNIVLLPDEENMRVEKQRVEESRATIGSLLEQLNDSFKMDNELQLLKQIEDARSLYIAAIDKSIGWSEKYRSGEARQVLFNEARPLQAVYFDVINQLIAQQKTLMVDTAKQINTTANSSSWVMLIITAAAGALGALIAWAITYSITRQLGGEPQYAYAVTREIAAGNLTVDVNVRNGDSTSLLFAMKSMRDSLAGIVSQVRSGTNEIATATDQIASGNLDLSSRTEQQASALQETASSMEELTSTVKQNSDNARQANQLAISASDVATQGGVVVSQVVDTMGSINESSRKIVDIISVIDGIAFQTNILALNAAVEAARAGEQGRGFAVVASEVRTLAQRSATAAREIKELIDSSVEQISAGSKLVAQAGTTMNEIVSSVSHVTDIMGEITSAGLEQESGIQQINLAITEMDTATQQNAALVEQAAAAAKALQEQSSNLTQVVNVFMLDDMQTLPVAAPIASLQHTKQKHTDNNNTRLANYTANTAKIAATSTVAAAITQSSTNDDWESF